MKRTIAALLTLATLASCAKGDPPCPPGVKKVSSAEADADLERFARKEVAAGRGGNVGVDLTCTGSGPRGTIGIPYRRIVDCIEQTIPLAAQMGVQGMTLSSCLLAAAQIEYARWFVLKLPDDYDLDADMDTAAKVYALAKTTKCVEVKRMVEVKADDHGLNRTGPDEWVPATLWLLLQVVDTALAPEFAPAQFILKPGVGVDTACDDTPPDPGKRCTDKDGCPDRPPGAEDADTSTGASGDVIPPGSTPGTPGGDHP